jgi:hypothetical protein
VFLLVSRCFRGWFMASEIGVLPHFARTCARQIVVEQVRAGIEAPRSRGVPGHPLHRLHVRAGADREARRVADLEQRALDLVDEEAEREPTPNLRGCPGAVAVIGSEPSEIRGDEALGPW